MATNKEQLKQYRREYYIKNKDKIDKKNKEYNTKNKEKVAARLKEYAKKNKDKLVQYRKEYFIKNRERIIEYGRKWTAENKDKKHRYYMKSRTAFFRVYGATCRCCGESTQEFLTIEHIQGRSREGNKQSSEVSYKEAIKEYRPDLYETLCMNCNHARGRFGVCPHERKQNEQ